MKHPKGAAHGDERVTGASGRIAYGEVAGVGARTGVLSAMWALVLRGLFQAGAGVSNHAYARDAVCPGGDLGPDGEEHPSPMRPGDRCHPGPDDPEVRTYEEQPAAQREERDDVVMGAWALGAGVLGLGGLSVQRRPHDARSRRLYDARSRHPWGSGPGD